MEREQALFRLFGTFRPEGTILFTEGAAGDEAFLVQSGAVRLESPRAGGDAAVTLGPGELLGEGALAGGSRRQGRAEVLADARLLQFNDRALDALVRQDPQTGRLIFDQLLERFQGARGALRRWTCAHLVRRISRSLVERAGAGVAAADLAEQTGLAEADVLLALEELRGRGCLSREGPLYRSADRHGLEREIEDVAAALEAP